MNVHAYEGMPVNHVQRYVGSKQQPWSCMHSQVMQFHALGTDKAALGADKTA